jgi:hypothetical protein
MLSPLPLVMVTFGLGSAFLPLAVVAGAVTVTVVTGSIPLATVFLAVDAVPVALLSRLNLAAMAVAGRPIAGAVLGRTVCWLVLVAGAAMVAGLAMMAAGPEGIEATLRQQIDQVLAAMPAMATAAGGETATTPNGIDLAAARAEMVKAVAGLLPGLVAWDWCLRAIISAGLAQLMLERMNLALWPTPAYRGFAAPQWYFALFGVTAMAAAVLKDDAGFIAGNAAAILSLPLVLQGLAVVHSAAGLVKYRLVWLAIFYVLALATADLSAVLLVGLGVMDQFLQIRGRYLAPRTGGE